MPPDSETPETPIWMVGLGWIISLLPAAVMLMSGAMKLLSPAEIADIFGRLQQEPPDIAKGLEHLQWDRNLIAAVGVIELASALIYLLPRTAVLGAILVTGYLGGALSTHVRVGDPFLQGALAPMILGGLAWLGLLLRDGHVRAVLPLRSPGGGSSWFVRILLVLLAAVIIFLIVAAFQPAEYEVERSITINAPASEVFPHVNNFHKWDAWSPWLKVDPNAQITYEGPESGKDAVFRWAGNFKAGEGSMTIVDSTPNERIKIDLEFLKPIPNTAVTDFTFKEQGEKTLVTWKMQGRNHLLGKAFQLVMNVDKMIGEKYDEGLESLKTVVEAKK